MSPKFQFLPVVGLPVSRLPGKKNALPRSHSGVFWVKKMSCCLAIAILLVGCRSTKVVKGTLKPADPSLVVEKPKGDNAFVREYSRKLGVNLPNDASPELIKAVADWMGTPYKFGGTDRNGIDCSAFINKVFAQAYKVTLPRTTQQMFEKAKTIAGGAAREGDIVFFKINTLKVSHAGILLFDDYFAHASSSKGVIISRLREPYWTRYYVGSGRFDVARP